MFAGRSSVAALEIENAVLRHQLAVLRRKAGRLRLRRMDRVLLAAASRLLPRERWSLFGSALIDAGPLHKGTETLNTPATCLFTNGSFLTDRAWPQGLELPEAPQLSGS
jgi:hypothetical protein